MQTDSILLSCSKILRKHHRILVYFVTWRDTWNISGVAAWFWWHMYSCLSSLLFVMFQATHEIPKPGEEWSYSKPVGLSWHLLIEARKAEDDNKSSQILVWDGNFPPEKEVRGIKIFWSYPGNLYEANLKTSACTLVNDLCRRRITTIKITEIDCTGDININAGELSEAQGLDLQLCKWTCSLGFRCPPN